MKFNWPIKRFTDNEIKNAGTREGREAYEKFNDIPLAVVI